MQKLLFATHNQNKAKEITALVGPSFEINTLDQVGYNEPVEESGQTLMENAFIKAQSIHKKLKVNCFADDTGLVVPALDGAPGVYSARYAGPEKSDQSNMALLLKNMQNAISREASFVTVICLILHGEVHYFEGELKGSIGMEQRGKSGFGYDPIFIPQDSLLTLAELDLEEKNKISHRALAFRKMATFLNKQ